MPGLKLASPISTALDVALDRTIAPGFSKVGLAARKRLPGWPADPAPDALAGQVALVTGASSGLGVATVRGLARLGAVVHLVVRDQAKGERVADELRTQVAGARLVVDRCDVSDLDDVRRFAADLGAASVSVLVHNAGAMPPQRTESAQGHEMTMALHVLGPVLMTELLLPRLTLRSRVIMVSSGGMYSQRLMADDPEFLEGDYSGVTAYARSKRAQVELVPLLDQRWRPRGVDVCAMHPGWADTPGVVESLPRFHKLTRPFLRDADGGADTTLWLAAAQPPPPPGLFWHDRRPRSTHLTGRTRTGTTDRDRLWAWVESSLTPDV